MSATIPVRVALLARLRAHAGVQAEVGGEPGRSRVFGGVADDPNDFKYIVVGDPGEQPRGASVPFGRDGHEGTTRIRAWVAGADDAPALRLYHEIEQALNRVLLPLDGHTMVSGRVRLITTQSDPDRRATQAVIEYRVHSRVSA